MKYFKLFESFVNESMINEGGMSNLYLIADEAKDLADFIKQALKEYDMLKNDAGTRAFLEEIYDEAKTNESFSKPEESVNESGTIKTGNAISDDLTDFLKSTVIPKSNGYVKNERDAAALLLDIIKQRYKF